MAAPSTNHPHRYAGPLHRQRTQSESVHVEVLTTRTHVVTAPQPVDDRERLVESRRACARVEGLADFGEPWIGSPAQADGQSEPAPGQAVQRDALLPALPARAPTDRRNHRPQPPPSPALA